MCLSQGLKGSQDEAESFCLYRSALSELLLLPDFDVAVTWNVVSVEHALCLYSDSIGDYQYHAFVFQQKIVHNI